MSRKHLILVLCLAAAVPFALGGPREETQQPDTKSQPAAAPAPKAAADAAKPAEAKPAEAKPAQAEGETPKYIKPETPEQRKARLGTAEDPGLDPDATKQWYRFGKTFTIQKFDRRWASYDDAEEGTVRPFGFVNVYKEIYQQNDKYVWVWMEEKKPEPVQPPPLDDRQVGHFSPEELNYYQKMRSEFTELSLKDSGKTIRFVESSEGLPTSGSWRASLCVADMNGDGFLDIIAPPERGGGNLPAIFLGDGKGHWKFWSGVHWPYGMNYGSIVAADFNKDGHMDLAVGVHLEGVHVLLGDGKGNFTDSSKGLPTDFATRRIMVTDVDRDGYPDIVAMSEGPTATQQNPEYGKLRVYLNRDKGARWEGLNVADPTRKLGGDWMAIGDFNGDKYPDFVGASNYFNGTEILYVSDGPKKWKVTGDKGAVIQYLGYFFAEAAGKFSSTKMDDALISYVRAWPTNLDPHLVPDPPVKTAVGIDRITYAGGKEPKRVPVLRWDANRGINGLAVGDFDGDGNLDFAYTRFNPRALEIALGDGKGNFTRATVEGVNLLPNTNWDLTIADVDGDGRPDLIIMYEAGGNSRFAQKDGAIQVFLNRTDPAKPAAKPAAKGKKQ